MLIVAIVFTGVFVVFALLLFASGAGSSKRTAQVVATLESALAITAPKPAEQLVDLRKEELLSSIPWVNRWLLRIELAPRLRKLLYQANLKMTTAGLLLSSAGCFVLPAYLVYLRTRAVLFSLLTGLAIGCVPLACVFRKRRQRFNKFEQELPGALDLIVSGLRAGHSLTAALGLVARECPDPVGTEFRICCDEQNYGLELRTAMDHLADRVPLQDLRIVATAILIQKESGGNLAEVLDKAAQVIRERFRLRRQVRTHTAQGRMTGWILSLLPLALGIALYLVNPDTVSILWTRPVGLKLLYTATGMTIIGGLIIRKIVQMEV